MIIGIGNDLAEVERIQASLENPRTGLRFRDRVFTPGEQAYCERRGAGKYQSYAARFAAKEAVMKALGTGWEVFGDLASMPMAEAQVVAEGEDMGIGG